MVTDVQYFISIRQDDLGNTQQHLQKISQIKLTFFVNAWIISVAGTESPLENLNINPDTIAISGFSSGGAFSTQFHVAFSERVGSSDRMMHFYFLPSLDIRRGSVCRPPLPGHLRPLRGWQVWRGWRPRPGRAHRPRGEHEERQRLHLPWQSGLHCALWWVVKTMTSSGCWNSP